MPTPPNTRTLIQDIRFCNDDIWRLCHDEAADALTANMIVAYLSEHLAKQRHHHVQDIPEISREELQSDDLSPSLRGEEMLRRVVSLSAEVRRLASQPLTARDKEGLMRVTERDLKVGTGHVDGTAVLLPTSQTIFLEKHSYTRDGVESQAVVGGHPQAGSPAPRTARHGRTPLSTATRAHFNSRGDSVRL